MAELLHLAVAVANCAMFLSFFSFSFFYREPINVAETAAKSKSRELRDTAFWTTFLKRSLRYKLDVYNRDNVENVCLFE